MHAKKLLILAPTYLLVENIGYESRSFCRCNNTGRSTEESLADPKVVAVNTFPQEGFYYAVLTCINADDKPFLEKMMSAYNTFGITDNRIILTNIMLGQSDSIAINPSYWKKIGSEKREHFTKLWRDGQESKVSSASHSTFNLFV